MVRALTSARATRGHLPEQVVLHADRGAQFTSRQLDETAREVGVRMSMGKTGVCWDNAMAESFWATLKVEYFYRHAFATRAQVLAFPANRGQVTKLPRVPQQQVC